MLINKIQLGLIILLLSPHVFASHSFGGLDMCALYPEVMPPGLPVEQLPDINSQPAQLMQTYCTQCHELPGPGRHTAEEWPSVLQRMLTLMDVANRFGGLLGKIKNPSNEERQQLQLYLSRYALKPLQQTPAGLGARAFNNHCSACHATPDPSQYNHDEWPVLLKRMQRNMTVMKYTPPSAEVMLQIQHYLQSNMTNDSITLTTIEKSKAVNKIRQAKVAMLYPESWLALGPFLLLVIIGFGRWWLHSYNKHHAHKNHNKQMKARQ